MMVIGRALARKGYGFIADREYFSNITGRHSYIHMLVSSNRIPRALKYPVELVAAMDAETIFMHFEDVSNNGIVIYDSGSLSKKISDTVSIEDITRKRIEDRCNDIKMQCTVESILRFLEREKGVRLAEINFQSVLRKLVELAKIDPRQISRYVSGIIVSAIATIMDIDEDAVRYSLSTQFRDRKAIVEQNIQLFRIVSNEIGRYRSSLKLAKPEINMDKVIFASGNDIVAIAKVVAGVRYQSYYPITPASDESFLLERFEYIESEDTSIGPIIVMQTEDEIAAITSAIGASLTGARSSTATSGPGFDLMVEGLSWAGANEASVVITYYQRGGPSTGQPTRGSQSDLLNAVFASHGEFARVVISSGDHLEAFYDTVFAFNIAEKFQVPVIHLLDKFLANSIATIPIPDLDILSIERGNIVKENKEYKRFNLNEHVSPRAFLGSKDIVMWYSGDEHDEYGHIVEDSENRIAMYSKRIEKLKLIEENIPINRKVIGYGDKNPDYIVLGWGSVKGVALEAIEMLYSRGIRGRYINVKMLWPFPAKEVLEEISKVPKNRVIAIEHSYGANITKLIAMSTGISIENSIVKFTGRPIVLNELVDALEKIILGKERRMVLRYGA
jgi:2-oxoglutarate ferredoxin oxidoreductase subunit alpha